MQGVISFLVVIQFVTRPLAVVGITLDYKDVASIINAVETLQSQVNQLHNKQLLLTEEVNSLKAELREQRLLIKQCLEERPPPNNKPARTTPQSHASALDVNVINSRQNYSSSIQGSQWKENERKGRVAEGSQWKQRKVRVTDDTSDNIAFSASAAIVHDLKANQVINFPNVITNIGISYNPHIGVFSCDISGTYVFYISILGENQSHIRTALVKDGVVIIHTHTPAVYNEYAGASNMAVVNLRVGDSLWVKVIDARANQNVNEWSTFSGFLHYPDPV